MTLKLINMCLRIKLFLVTLSHTKKQAIKLAASKVMLIPQKLMTTNFLFILLCVTCNVTNHNNSH